jgi:hypothetical protein
MVATSGTIIGVMNMERTYLEEPYSGEHLVKSSA